MVASAVVGGMNSFNEAFRSRINSIISFGRQVKDKIANSWEKAKNTDEYKSYVRCPRCDKMLFQAVAVVDTVIKCDKCHRRYLLNVNEQFVSIRLLSKSQNIGET